MIKKGILSGLIALGLATSVQAYDLKANMYVLNTELAEIQNGFITNSKDQVAKSLTKFNADVQILLSNKDKISEMLPEDVRYKANIAVDSAKMINENVKLIESILADDSMKMIRRQEQSQKAFLDIQRACFKCHNLVRDWSKK